MKWISEDEQLCSEQSTKSASLQLCSAVVPSDELDLEPKLKRGNQEDIWAVQFVLKCGGRGKVKQGKLQRKNKY